jgi:hypothetical protein
MRHGEPSAPVGHAPGSDPTLRNVHADMTSYLILERTFCRCDAVCVCGWDEHR